MSSLFRNDIIILYRHCNGAILYVRNVNELVNSLRLRTRVIYCKCICIMYVYNVTAYLTNELTAIMGRRLQLNVGDKYLSCTAETSRQYGFTIYMLYICK